MNQSNFEDSGVWMTRNTKKQLARIISGGQGEIPDVVSKAPKGQVLPRDTARKNPNAYGGARVTVSGGLDNGIIDFDASNDGASEVDDSLSSGYHDEADASSPDEDSTTIGSGRGSKFKGSLKSQTGRVDALYDDWVKKKNRILEIIASPGYSSLPDWSPYNQSSSDPVRNLLDNIPDGFNVSRDNGLYVFAPTLSIYQDFSRFLAVVEEIAGREHGVVKVIVPKDSMADPSLLRKNSGFANNPSCRSNISNKTSAGGTGSSTSSNDHATQLLTSATHMMDLDIPFARNTSDLLAPTLNASAFTMALNEKTQSDIRPIYNIKSESVGAVSPKDWRGTIEEHRHFISKAWGMCDRDRENAWKEGNWETMLSVSEKAMIQDFESGTQARLYAVDNDASNELREALRCHNLKLESLPGNSLMKSKSRIAGIHTPYFYVSNSECTPFGIHIEDYAAYSISYLHVGAPKCWRVIRPDHHRDVEEFLDNHLNPPARQLNTSSGRALPHSPHCSQFLRHSALYLPRMTLDMLDIPYTSVVQQQGEMIITFPFAYHEGWNTGPNIAEAIGYASQRWEIFIREGLYQNCHKLNCRQMPLKMDFGFLREGTRRAKPRPQLTGSARKKARPNPIPSATRVAITGSKSTPQPFQTPASLQMTPLQIPTPAPSGSDSIDPSPTAGVVFGSPTPACSASSV